MPVFLSYPNFPGEDGSFWERKRKMGSRFTNTGKSDQEMLQKNL